jgi:hypothetical protein
MTTRRSIVLAKLLVVIPLLLPASLSICKCQLALAYVVAQIPASTVQATYDSASSPHRCGKCGTKNTDNCLIKSPGHRCNCTVSPTDSQGLIPQYRQDADPTHEFAFAYPVQIASDARYQASHAATMVTEYPPGTNSTPLFQLNSLLRI